MAGAILVRATETQAPRSIYPHRPAWVLMAGSVITSLLMLYVIARVWSKAFYRTTRGWSDC